MPRFRRYRVFLVSAFFILLLLFQVAKNSNWEPSASYPHGAKEHSTLEKNIKPPGKVQPNDSNQYRGASPDDAQAPPRKEQTIHIPTLKGENGGYRDYALPPVTAVKTSTTTAAVKNTGAAQHDKPGANTSTSSSVAHKQTQAVVDIPDRVPDTVVDESHSTDDNPFNPQKQALETATTSSKPTPPTPHWQKQSEYFPVPTESLIRLPTGSPKPIPRIQASFPRESASAKEKRERRLLKIKTEAERAWHGYKKYAWTHDEVKPVSKVPRDPFCGWAATLVDALDTLWIMGLKSEFEAGVEAVRAIDFTTTPYRSDIPVFETVIRYLGGLLAAYDVSGGKEGGYEVLLDKALELAEILMGVFDTPNRMPVLYYSWKPEYASQPHRASASSSVAELGSMAMEFTRLAQLTGEDRYYDAIARVTDAFEEWQRRGTALDGIFPQVVDASGCNRTAMNLLAAEAASEAAKAQAVLEGKEDPVGYTPAAGVDTSAEGEGVVQVKGAGATGGSSAVRSKLGKKNRKRDAGGGGMRGGNGTAVVDHVPAVVGKDLHSGTRAAPLKANGLAAEWDCPAQGLVSGGYGSDSYGMGGSQDSAYEYFPKQYLLLGGLEPKYKTMHEKTVRGVKKYLLYRPMIEDEKRDLLFSAKAFSYDGTDQGLTFDYEVTHLTCFLGGMFGLGGKIFGSEEDVEIGKKLADGCAWAYEVMPTGVMPEAATVMPCKSVAGCEWNQTAWWDKLDPQSLWREEQMEEYKERMEIWEEEVRNLTAAAEEEKEAVLRTQKADELERKVEEKKKAEEMKDRTLRPVNDTLPGEDGPAKLKVEGGTAAGETTYELRGERDISSPKLKRSTTDGSDSVLDRARNTAKTEELAEKLESELDFNSASGLSTGHHDYDGQVSLSDKLDLPPKPIRPQTHEEYVKDRLEKEHIPGGFVMLNDKRYILRPEAIESVWYMYRITGDPVWQEKGWRMFESVIAATSTAIGHSAIADVTASKTTFTDNMESFWLAETLKYFYLLFAPPDVVSLDEWVFNTEAHPFRRPT